jgi:hypothetical protein
MSGQSKELKYFTIIILLPFEMFGDLSDFDFVRWLNSNISNHPPSGRTGVGFLYISDTITTIGMESLFYM